MKFTILPLFLAITLCIVACNKKDDATNSVGESFDKTAMLTQYADSLIMPEYVALQARIAELQTASESFIQAPDAGTQTNVLDAYTKAYSQYEHVAAFQFGPAETALLDPFVNFSGGLDYSFTTAGQLTGFSVDSATIEQRSAGGSYDLTSMTRSSFYSQGFGTLGYLYFAPNAITKLQASASRAAYIRALNARLKSLTDKVVADWSAYRQTFIDNTKTNVGSPIGNIVNQLAYQLDVEKGPRIGWPYGKQSNGIVFATKCESYYAGISKTLAIENLKGLKKLYQGAVPGIGLADYLVALKQNQLNQDLLAQFDLAISRLEAIPAPLSDAFTAHPTDVDAAYREVQKLLTMVKTDLASATAVQINFMDNDGD
jgi:predicted lipoprotein